MRLKHIWIFTLILLGCEKIDLKWKLDKLPTLVSLDATKITSVNAESGGNISSDGGAPITQRGVCWSVDENPTTTNNKTSDGSGTGNYVSILDNLQPDTKYYVRAYATNTVGTSYGNQVSFTTLPELASLTTLDATKITSVNAESGGNISSDGGAPITQRGVCWSFDENPTTVNNRTSDGSGTGNYISIIDNLQRNTKYYVRAYATNKVGTSYGNQVSFTTLPELVSTNNCNSLNGFSTFVEQGTPNGSQAWYIDAGYINNGLKVTSCFGGYVEFSMNLSSITKMRFWAKGSSPKVIVDGTLINTTMIQGASNTWMQLETQSIASGAHTIRIDFPRSPVYRTLYVDEIEFYAY
jgi:FlaG/FlaF family flagellin (archaellin)